MNKDKLTHSLKDIMSDWAKPKLIFFLISLIFYSFFVTSKTIFNHPFPSWLFISVGVITKIAIFYYLSKLYSNSYYQNLTIPSNIFIWLAFIPIITSEYILFEGIVPLIMSVNIINWIFLLKLVEIALCSVIPSLLIVYYRYIDRVYPFAQFFSDSIILVCIYIISNMISKLPRENITIYKITMTKEECYLTILIILSLLYSLIINIFLNWKKSQEIINKVNNNYKMNLCSLAIPYLESNSNTGNKKEIKYRVYIIGSIISYFVLLLNFSVLIPLNNGVNHFNFSDGITSYYLIFLIRFFILNVAVVAKEDLKMLSIISIITLATTVMVTFLINFDIGGTNKRTLDFASISMLLWVLPKIVPSIMDNVILQTEYSQGKKFKYLIQYRALSAFANIFIYIFLLILLILVHHNQSNVTLGHLYVITANSFALGSLFSVILVITFSFLLYQCKSLYSKITIQRGKDNSEALSAESRKENKSGKNSCCSNVIINLFSITICSSLLFTFYSFSNSDTTFEMIKLSLPIFVPTFLDKIQYFLNYYLLKHGEEIKLTEKANYVKSIIDVNLFLIVVILYIYCYITKVSLNIFWVLGIVVFIHVISYCLRFLPILKENKDNPCV